MPPLPHTTYNGYSDGSEPLYTAEQMHGYAREVLAHAGAPEEGIAQQLERIAASWDGHLTETKGGEEFDIGADLRREFAKIDLAHAGVGAKTDYVLMPKRLTAENGAKGALSGEFKESVHVTCPVCDGSGDDPDFDGDPAEHGSACLECNGEGTVEQGVPVSWDTIKDIYKSAIELLAAPSSDDVRNAAPSAEPEAQECWSTDEENFNATELCQLLDENDHLKAGDTVWVGEAVRPDPKRLFNTDWLLENMGEAAYDIAGEHADDYPDVSKEDVKELEALVTGWIKRACPPSFWTVENVKPYVLSHDDFPNDPTSLNASFAAPAAAQSNGDAGGAA